MPLTPDHQLKPKMDKILNVRIVPYQRRNEENYFYTNFTLNIPILQSPQQTKSCPTKN